MTSTPSLAILLERFFTQRLMQQRQASPHDQFLSRHLSPPPRIHPAAPAEATLALGTHRH